MSINVDGIDAVTRIYFAIDYASTIQNVTDQFSFGAWCKRDAAESYGKVIIREDTGGGDKEMYILYMDDANHWRAFVRNAAGSYGLINGSTTISNGTWYHVACTYDGSNVRLYVNGVQEGSDSALTGNIKNTTDDPIYIGVDPTSGPATGDKGFDGSVSDIFIIKRALSLNEIKTLANRRIMGGEADSIAWIPCWEASGVTDYSQYAHAITETNSPTYNQNDEPAVSYEAGAWYVEDNAAGGGPAFKPYWARYANQIITTRP